MVKPIRYLQYRVWKVIYVPKNQKKNTLQGKVSRARALAKKAREKAKNVTRNVSRAAKKSIRVIDDVFQMNPELVALSGMGGAAMAVNKVRSVIAPKVSPCIKKWYTCLTSPFHQNAMGACIPSGDVHSSMRRFGFMRFDVVVGTAGCAFVALSPNLSNNAPQAYVSDAGYLRSDVSILTGNNTYRTGVRTVTCPNLPFSASQLYQPNPTESQVQGRIVGGGMRIQYTGRTTEQAGLTYFYADPQHIAACSFATGAGTFITASALSLGTFQETIIKPVSREPSEYVLAPTTSTELEYYTPLFRSSVDQAKDIYPWGENAVFQDATGAFTTSVTETGGTSIGPSFITPIAILFISGAVPGSTFHVEYGLHQEYVGSLSQGQRLPADSDPVGVSNMLAAISRATLSDGSSKSANFSARLKESYAEVVKSSMQAVNL